jgi:hypothetical protein
VKRGQTLLPWGALPAAATFSPESLGGNVNWFFITLAIGLFFMALSFAIPHATTKQALMIISVLAFLIAIILMLPGVVHS